MKLQVHSIHFDADIKLIDFIQKKLNKLETFYDRLVDGEVFLHLITKVWKIKRLRSRFAFPAINFLLLRKLVPLKLQPIWRLMRFACS